MGWPDLGGGPKTWEIYQQSQMSSWQSTHREHDRNAASHGLAAVQCCLLAQPQVLRLAAVALPARDRGAIQEHLNALA